MGDVKKMTAWLGSLSCVPKTYWAFIFYKTSKLWFHYAWLEQLWHFILNFLYLHWLGSKYSPFPVQIGMTFLGIVFFFFFFSFYYYFFIKDKKEMWDFKDIEMNLFLHITWLSSLQLKSKLIPLLTF